MKIKKHNAGQEILFEIEHFPSLGFKMIASLLVSFRQQGNSLHLFSYSQ
jgi:hypothetical protein